MKSVMVSFAAIVAGACGLSACDVPSSSAHGTTAGDNPNFHPQPSWETWTNKDNLHGVTWHLAKIASRESFPDNIGLEGRVTTTLTVQRHGRNLEVVLENPNLQFTCSGFTDTYVVVKFDEHAARRFSCTEERTSQYGVAIIPNGARFVQELQHAKMVTIGADVFQRGEMEMTFDNPGPLPSDVAAASPTKRHPRS